MLLNEVIDKLSLECCQTISHFDDYGTIRKYIQRAIVVGIEHFNPEMEEIIVTNQFGIEQHRFKSVKDTVDKLNLDRSSVLSVISGRRNMVKGLSFIRRDNLKEKKRRYQALLRSTS